MEKSLERCLLQAILADDHQTITQLLLQGANPNKVVPSGRTSLGEASHLGKVNILKMLLDVCPPGENKVSSNDSNTCKRHKHQKRKLSDHQGELFCKSKIKEQREGKISEDSATVKLDDKVSQDQNCGYFVVKHEEDSSQDDGSHRIPRSPASSSSLTPSPQDDLEWDEDIGDFASVTSDDETWSSMYRWYATILERTGTALAFSVVASGIDQQDLFMRTAVHYASETENGAALQLLLDAGCKVDIPDARGMMPLHLAVIKNNEEAVKMLLAAGTRVHNMTHEKMTPLHFAASSGNVEMVKILIKSGARLETRDINECTPLHLAAMGGHEDVVKYLIAAGANVNSEEMQGYTPLCEAVWQRCASVVEILIQSGARITHSHKLLYDAILHQEDEIVRMLIVATGGVNLHNENGDTPLMLATRLARYKIAKLLLENGANINLCNSLTGTTALHIAVECVEAHLFEEFLLCFLEYKMDINFISLTGDTALNRALLLQRDHAAFLLIKHGADVNLWDFEACGLDTLAIVCKRRNTFLASLLVKVGHILPAVDYNCAYHVAGSKAHFLYHTCSLPLSLSDLCRIKIRRMAKDTVMHKYVDSLPLPKSLKRFLMLED